MSERERRGTGAAGAEGAAGRARPDASMSLLADLFAGKVLDPGYEEAAARRRARGGSQGGGRRPLRRAGLFAAVVVLGMLGVVAVLQVRRDEPAAERQREALAAGIRERTAETEGLRKRAEELRTETERLRETALVDSKAGRSARSAMNRAANAAAASPVSGSGLRVTVDDARGGRQPAEGRIYDKDLQLLVNGLWASGARAIAINDQRLTATTAIRSAGQAILVDYRPLSPPYAVSVLGKPEKVEAEFADSAAGRQFRTLQATYGMRFDISRPERVRLPAATGLRLRYAEESSS